MVDDEEDGYDGFDVTAGGETHSLLPPSFACRPLDPPFLNPAITSFVESQTQKKPYEIAYQIKTIEELQAEQRDLVNRVSALVECDVSENRSRKSCL